MGSPASRLRKPKPVAIFRTSRLWTVLDQSHQAMPPTMPTTSTCQTMPRTRSSDQDSRRGLFGGARSCLGSMVVWDIAGALCARQAYRGRGRPRGRPRRVSAEGRRVLQPAMGPERVRAALDADRLQGAVEELAVIADGLDDVHPPAVGQAEHRAEAAILAEDALHLRPRVVAQLVDIG